MTGARRILLVAMLAIALMVAAVSGVAYVHHHLWLGAVAVVLLGLIAIFGTASLWRERRRLAGLALDLDAATPTSSLWTERRGRLEALAKAGVRPDLDQLAQAVRASESGRAFLGKYFVAVTVLVGLVGTFAGLMEMLRGVQPLLAGTDAPGLDVLVRPLIGLDVTFGASVVGILVTLALTLLSGDLTLAEEAVLARLEERTAHELVPALWPPAATADQQILRLLTSWHAAQEEAATKSADQLATRVGATFATHTAALIDTIEARVGGAHAETLQRLDETLDKAVNATLLRLDTTVARTLAELSSQLQTMVKSIDHSTKTVVGSLDQSVKATMTGLESSTKHVVSSLDRSSKEAVASLDRSAKDVVTSLDGSATLVLTSLEASTKQLVGSLDQSATNVLHSLDQSAKSVVGSLDKSATHVVHSLDQSSKSLIGSLDRSATTVLQSLDQSTKSVVGALDQSATSVVASLDQSTKSLVGALDQSATKVLSTLDQSAKSTLGALDKSATHVVQSLDQSAKSTLGTLDKSALDVVQSLGHSTKSVVGSLDASATTVLQSLDQSTKSVVGSLDASALATLAELGKQATALTATHRLVADAEEARRHADQQAAQESFIAVAAALQPILVAFGEAARALSAETSKLSPELAALTQEIAILAARTEPAATPVLLDELARLAGTVAELQGDRA